MTYRIEFIREQEARIPVRGLVIGGALSGALWVLIGATLWMAL